MDSTPTRTFNSVYSGNDCYYGLEVRPEFSDYFNGKNLNGMSALDLGCGEGRYGLYLAEKGCHVIGVDRSGVGLEKLKKMASEKNLRVETLKVDISEFDFEGASFDVIVAATVLDHLENAPRRRAIKGIKSALKPEGILYANVFTVADPGYKLKKGHTGNASTFNVSDTASGIAHYFAREELKSVFADFSIINYYEKVEPDHSHGRPHYHGWACLLAKKPSA